jgi:hypothetical protein
VLQKAADDELDAPEITGVTLRQNSGLDYVSIFARARTVRRVPMLAPLGYGVNSTTFRIEGRRNPGGLDRPAGK